MLINVASIRRFCADQDKQASESFLQALDHKVRVLILKSIKATNPHKRVLDIDLQSIDKMKHIGK